MITLSDILVISNTYQVLKIFDMEGNKLCEYNESTNIDDTYKNKEVRLITGRNYGFDIMINFTN